MKSSPPHLTRREFTRTTLLAGTALASGALTTFAADKPKQRIRVGVIGCGSVSRVYLPNLLQCAHAEVVSLCDIRPERAHERGDQFKIANRYPNLEAQLAGVPFDFLVNLTDMQAHEALNRRALEAGKHVWSEKPIANSLAAGQVLLALALRKKVRLWGAPIPVQSPQFAFLARTLASGALGRVAAAHAEYGHEGPGWSSFFYEKLGGSLPDLGVYNLTTLTGLLGPAKSVTALLSIVTPERDIEAKGKIKVTEEDNASVLLDHGQGVISHTQSGFNYFNPHGHEGRNERRHTVTILGSRGFLGLVGYDWEPLGVDFSSHDKPELTREAVDAQGYVWQQGASLAAEVLATGNERLLATPEHALHVLDIICAARESSATGRRIELKSTFKWPVVA
ncbi:MAG: Gfo/Idh/MocA family protein [Limisphaerales bacterium]